MTLLTPKELFPSLAAQITYLLDRKGPLDFRVENVRKGFPNARFADRFTLLVPCCLDYVEWDIIFNSDYPWLAPDIIFSKDDEKFSLALLVDESQGNLKSPWNILKSWSTNSDPSKFLRLVADLRLQYLQYQRGLVEEVDDPRVRFEISTNSNIQGLEMCLVKIADKAHEVKFAVPLLRLDLSQLKGQNYAIIHLQVVFPVRKHPISGAMVPQLKLFAPPALKEVFDVEDVKLPVWPEGMCLAEYAPTLKETLKRQVHDAYMSIDLRRNFIEGLFTLFGRPLEAETTFGRRVSVLASSGIFVFLVHFFLSTLFPKQQPTLTLQSCQHFDNIGKPITRAYKDFPWSPRWDSTEMVQRIYDFIVDESNNFKKYCNDVLQHHR